MGGGGIFSIFQIGVWGLNKIGQKAWGISNFIQFSNRPNSVGDNKFSPIFKLGPNSVG